MTRYERTVKNEMGLLELSFLEIFVMLVGLPVMFALVLICIVLFIVKNNDW